MPVNSKSDSNVLSVDLQGWCGECREEYVLTAKKGVSRSGEMIQNVWSLAIVCFSEVLAKISKYINLKHKIETISPKDQSLGIIFACCYLGSRV